MSQPHQFALARRLLPLLLCIILLPAGAARAAALSPASNDPFELPAIAVADSQFTLGGVPFEVRGVNYIHPSGTAAGCPELHFGADARCPWDLAAIDADMDRLRALGVNTVRIFLNYYVFGGARAIDPNYSLEQPLAHLDALIESANRRGIYVLPVLLAKFPQDQLNQEGYAQALALHVDPLVSHLAGRPGLLGWDLFNEPDIGSPIDERCWDWDNGDFPLCAELAAQRIAFLTDLIYEVRWRDPGRPLTIGMAFAKSYFRPAHVPSPLAALVDFYSFHYYDDDPKDSGRYAEHWYYGAGLPIDLQRGILELHMLPQRKPVLVSELGFPAGEGARRDAEAVARDLRLSLETIRQSGGAGTILWPFAATPEEQVGALFTETE